MNEGEYLEKADESASIRYTNAKIDETIRVSYSKSIEPPKNMRRPEK
ncbi:MAG: hypothetical protein MUO26_10320 [Methanotrichaceae archaeon]|nr:hypothetical protein [Methanotrichaceae archaeon]